ncbi:MAG: hypothetical protein K0R26_672 [Bacteroidota bacterium]|jgi:hypothetical protein|nr:hypothetical protein [Bacteroidota bacterium]
MKKTLLLAALLISGMSQLIAQCTITPGCAIGSAGYCTTPATATPLPNGTVLNSYNTTIQVSIGTSAFGGAATITNATVTSVSGLPAGLTYAVNPSNGVINGGGNGCILISGTPASGSAGNYTVAANIIANTNFGPVPASGTWPLTIDMTTSLKEHSKASFVIAPNPASSQLVISADFHFGKIQVIDALGKIVISNDANYTSQATLDVQNLSSGVYFIQINDSKSLLTRKFIKE